MTAEDPALRADVHLLALIATARKHLSYEMDPEWFPGAHEITRAEVTGALDAALAVGAVSSERAAQLRTLLDERPAEQAEVGLTAPVIPALTLERIELLVPAAADDVEGIGVAFTAFDESLRALHAAGAIDERELDRWYARVGIEPEEAGGEPRTERLLALRGVLPGSPARGDGDRVHSVACFTGGVVVRWECCRRGSWREDRLGERSCLQLLDDAGTEYLSRGGGGGVMDLGDRWISEREDSFSPGVPADARTLTVTTGGARFDFDVTGMGEREAT